MTTLDTLCAAFSAASPTDKAMFLARVAYNSTIDARATAYVDDYDKPDGLLLRCYSEFVHRVTGYMMHVLIFAAICGLLLGASGARATDKLPTMGQVLAMCDSKQPSDEKGCSVAVRAIAMTTYDAAGGPETDVKLCLPPPTVGLEVWREKIVEWTRKHPEKQSMTEADALYPFVIDNFRCP